MPPITIFIWFIAACPIVLLLILLLGFRLPLVKASALSMFFAFATAVIFFKAPLNLLNGEIAKGIWSSLSILIVIFSAILMYEVSRNINAFQTIQQEVTRLIPDKLLQVLAIGWCFTGFLQGPSGFGVPIAVVAPLLIGIGVRPLWAVIIPLIAQSWGSTFGTLGLAWDALVEQTSLATQIYSPLYFQTAYWSALLIGILCFSSGWVICWFYGSWAAIRHGAIAVFILGTVQAVGQLILSQISPTLCAFIPASVALFAVFFIAKLPQYSGTKTPATSIMNDVAVNDVVVMDNNDNHTQKLSIMSATLPYILLVCISLGTLLNPMVYEYLSGFQLAFSFPATETGYGIIIPEVIKYSPITLFLHSGFFIFLATIIALLFYMSKSIIKPTQLMRILHNTLVKSVPASLAVMFLIILSKIMNGSGEIMILAQGTANITGNFYSFFAPFIGGIGAFMSGSNVSSNILFGQFQQSIANVLNANEAVIIAAQTSGAAAGALIDPAKILLGTSTANIAGCEGDVLRKLFKYFLCMVVIMGLIVSYFA